jgi:glycosyltransferase involved in cell wall biosynthesis
VEGLAYGKAIITTSIGAEGIPYMHNKNMMIADSSEDFIAAILTLLNNPDKKADLQLAARDLAEKTFDYRKIAADLIIYYHSL